ncbi:MAG: putative porin, partial [Thermoanaerobaculales bacterium]|nr:putative porin [Thermoanaerobaculales bacterium]
MKRMLRVVTTVMFLFCAVVGVGAEEIELDPLLELLVEQGVITMEQALAVQAEYDRRSLAEQTPAAPALPVVAAQTVAIETPAAPAEEKVAEKKDDKWYDRIDFKGDLRLRSETFWVDGISSNDRRQRFRARIRPGIYTDITDWMEVGLQLRSGDPDDPVSDNSSFDGGFSLIPISISEGFAGFHPTNWLDLTLGKFDPKKKWVVTDMQWDDDVTVEGAMEELSWGPLKFDLYQYILEEEKSDRDSYLLGGQLYGKFGSDSIGSFTVGAGFDSWVRPQKVVDLTRSGKLKGNRVTNLLDDQGQLISDFEIVNAFAIWSWNKSERWPVKFSVFGYVNTGA